MMTKPTAVVAGECSFIEAGNEANELYDKSRFGILLENGKLQISFLETFYLAEKGKVVLVDGKGKSLTMEQFLKKARKHEHNFWIRSVAFKDLRDRGYIVKTALKFGADFRVYDRGVKPGEDHAKWVVFPVHETAALTWYEFAAKNRVAHSTKKRLLLAIVDDEGDCTYYECKWTRP